jgi:hypothetical protein
MMGNGHEFNKEDIALVLNDVEDDSGRLFSMQF